MDLLRKTVFLWSVFLATVLFDASGWRSPAEHSVSPVTTRTHVLSVQLLLADGQVPTGGRINVSRQESETFRAPLALELVDGRLQARLDAGRYLLITHVPGAVRETRFVDLDRDRRLELSLQPSQERVIEVMQHTDGELRPLPGATVLLSRDSDLPFGALTGADGKATLTEIPQGEMVVRVYAPGFEPYQAVTAGDLLVRLRPVRALRASVTKNGENVPDATVWISGLSLWPARAVRTGPKGYIDITGLAAGRYTLGAEFEDFVSEERDVELVSSPGIERVTLELLAGSFVVADVVDPEERPIASAHVTHTLVGLGARAHRGETNAAGRVRLGPLRQLTGQLQVHARGFLPTLVEVDGQVPQQIQLSPSGSVTGRVVDARGRPVAGAFLEVLGTDIHGMPVAKSEQLEMLEEAHFQWSTSSQNVLLPAGELGVLLGPVPGIPMDPTGIPFAGRRLTTDDKGRFHIDDVPPGRLVVVARHEEYMDGKSLAFDLAPGGTRDVEIVLGNGVPLRGRVLDDRGFPVQYARIRVCSIGFDRQVLAERDGTFELSAAPLDVRLRVSRPEAPLSILLEVPVSNAARSEEVLLELPPPRSDVELRCQDPQGAPLPLVQVSVVSLQPEIPLQMTRFSDRTGELVFEQARGLPVHLEAQAPGFVRLTRELTLGSELNLTLEPSLAVRGRITAVRGRQPAANALVSIRVADVHRTTRANDLGEYEFSDVPPGKGILRAEHPELGKAGVELSVRPGIAGRKGTLPDLDLVPAAKVRGRVVDARGHGVPRALLALDRIGAYLLPGTQGDLGRSDDRGNFDIEIDQTQARYLFASQPAQAFGFSDRLTEAELEGRESIEVLLDRRDAAEPDELATVLISLEAQPGRLIIYSVAPRSSAHQLGLRREDQLLLIDGVRPSGVSDARRLLSGRPGSDVLLSVSQGGMEKTMRVTREPFAR